MPLDPNIPSQIKTFGLNLGSLITQAQEQQAQRVQMQAQQQQMARQQQADQIAEAKRKSDLVVQTLQGVNDPESFALAKQQLSETVGPDAAQMLGDTYSPGRVRQVLSSHMPAHEWLTQQNNEAMQAYRQQEVGIQQETGERADRRAEALAAQQKSQADAAAARDALTAENVRADNERANRQVDSAAKAAEETARHNQVMEKRPVAGAATRSQDVDDAEAIADAIAKGDQPPVTTGLFRLAGPVRSALAKKGYNLATANQDWTATQKHLSTLNGAQQTRMAQAIDNAAHSLDVIDDLAGQWQGGKFPLLNKAQLKLATGGALGPKAQEIATKLEAQISDVTSELGNVYMGGNSPTDHALGLAGKNLSAEWTESQLKAAIQLARTNLQIRQNSMRNVGVAGASANNPYAPQQAPAAPTTGGDRVRVKGPNGESGTVPRGTSLPTGWAVVP